MSAAYHVLLPPAFVELQLAMAYATGRAQTHHTRLAMAYMCMLGGALAPLSS